MKKLNIIYGLLFFTLLVSMCSCGARKVNKTQSKEETTQTVTDNSTVEKKSETNVKTTKTVNVDDKNETVTEETIYEPKDPAIESFIIEKDGTKVVLNNTKKTVKKTTQKNNTQTNKVENSETKQNDAFKEQKSVKEVVEYKKENKSKETKKENFNWLSLWWIYIIILCLLYFFRKSIPLLKLIP